MIYFELFAQFAIVSMLAFGGGNAALSLLERISVQEMRWITPEDFAAAVGFAYATPGPILITAAFIGYRGGGMFGSVAATVGVFLIPWVLSVLASHQVRGYMHHSWLEGFGRGAGPAVIGLLGITAYSLGSYAFVGWLYWAIAGLACVLAMFSKVSPIIVLIAAALLGGLAGPVLTD